jgi:type I restriction-modification system DNA methylase subunit
MDKEKAKAELKIILERYNKLKLEKETDVKSKEEEKTKTKLIRPLFEKVLGWDFVEDVTPEEKISKGWVDYGFRINEVPKFFLEAKGLRENLENPTFFQQAYSYAYYKKCAWAVLTNFEVIEIINAESEAPYNQYSHMTIKCEDFLDKFDDLWLLSEEGFEQGLLDKLAERFVRRPKRMPFDKQLLYDFTRFRDMLSKNITKLNEKRKLSEEDLDESVQRILNRLIFIRNCEDRELEEKKLWEAKNEAKVWKKLEEVFAYYDKHYDSKLFTYDLNDPKKLHLCDTLDIEDGILRTILNELYQTKDRSVSYDFKIIPANILGTVYEQYLSHILKKTEKRAVLADNQTHRKEQGIYYTPTHIVEYIVKNTLGELMKGKAFDIEKIKVLDPACGSGSFLTKAFDFLNECNIETNSNFGQTSLDFKTDILFKAKTKLLQNNIFGVDLDKQAIEITQLNLLPKIAEKRHRLPLLEQNIKCGNSLIKDRAIAGDKAFEWSKEFQAIINGAKFDAVIGNPPYIENRMLSQEEVDYFHNNFSSAGGRLNTFAVFVEQGLNLLKDGGYLGFIIHRNAIKSNYYEAFRKLILNNACIMKIVDLKSGIFREVTGEMVILILKKESDENKRKKNRVEILTEIQDLENNFLSHKVDQQFFSELPNYRFNISINTNDIEILEKIKQNSVPLSDVADTKQGIIVGDEKKYITQKPDSAKYKKVLRGRDIGKYTLNWNGEYVFYDREKLVRAREQSIFEQEPKILTQHVSGKIVATLDEQKYFALQTINLVLIKEETKLSAKYILALLNSNLLNFYYDKYFNMGSDFTTAVSTENLDTLPIHKISFSDNVEKRIYDNIIAKVEQMLNLNNRLARMGNKETDEKARLEEKKNQINTEIDETVYELYKITKREQKIIESSL